MKKSLQIFFLVQIIILGCTAQERKLNSITTTERYEYIGAAGQTDTLELKYKNDSLIDGLYKGVYKDNENTLFFYSSPIDISKSNSNYDLVFKLDSLTIYKEGIQISGQSDSNNETGIGNLPVFFSQPISFLGKFAVNELKITRISGLNIFSSADDMVFKKVPPEYN